MGSYFIQINLANIWIRNGGLNKIIRTAEKLIKIKVKSTIYIYLFVSSIVQKLAFEKLKVVTLYSLGGPPCTVYICYH